jgi:hypothetical protein
MELKGNMQIKNQSDSIEDSDDDLALIADLWHALCEGWRWIAGGMFLGLLAAFLILQAIPKKWQAVVLVQVGQVGQVGQVNPIPIETPQQAIERIETGAFQIEVASALQHQNWLKAMEKTARGGKGFFTAKVPTKNSTRIEIASFGSTPENARQIAEGIVSALGKRHEKLIEPTKFRLQSELALTQEKLKTSENIVKSLGAISTGSIADSRFSQAVLLNSLRTGRENEVHHLRQHATALKIALDEPMTQPTRMIEAVYVAADPVSPRTGLVLAVGIAGGVLLGVAPLFFRSRRASGAAQ